MSDDRPAPFSIEPDGDAWRVASDDGRTILRCDHERSARHYLELIERAWRTGFKAGYRAGRQTGGGPNN